MSETITLTTATATIYGSLAGARAYLGAVNESWDVAADSNVTPDQKRALVKARRYIDGLSFQASYDTFAERDAYTTGVGSGDEAYPFRAASYELAAVLVEDPDAVTVSTGRKVASISAGGDSVTYQGAETKYAVHPSVLALLGPYLSEEVEDAGHDGSAGVSGCVSNPFSLTGVAGTCGDDE